MRFLFEYSKLTYLYWHSCVIELRKIYPHAEFGAIAYGEAYDFLKQQKDINYVLFEYDNLAINVPSKVNSNDIDYELLKDLERGLEGRSLWKAISSCRGIGSTFVHDSIDVVDCGLSKEQILKTVEITYRRHKEVFDEFRPTHVIPIPAGGGMEVYYLHKLAQDYKAQYLSMANLRVQNYFGFADNVQLVFREVDDLYRDLEKDHSVDSNEKEEANVLYEHLYRELKCPDYFDRRNSRFNLPKVRSDFKKAFKSVVAVCLAPSWAFYLSLKKKSFRQFSGLVSWRINFEAQKWKLTGRKLEGEVDFTAKYIYFPLHVTPEYSTSMQATMWMDQLNLIEGLAKSIPCDWVVYVKEHPGTLVCRVRPSHFYDKIMSFPNVKLLPIDTDMHTIISNAQCIAVITGTSGWEGIWRKRPVLNFADCPWDVLGLSTRCNSLETLTADLFSELEKNARRTDEERKRKLVHYIWAVMKNGFKISNPNEFVFIEPLTDEICKNIGKDLAKAFQSRLEREEAQRGQQLATKKILRVNDEQKSQVEAR